MSAATTRIRNALFGAAIAVSLGTGVAAARAEPAPPREDGHCYAITHSAERCRYFCSTIPATGYTWDPYTGCCVCTFF